MSRKFKFSLGIVLFSLSVIASAQNQYDNKVVVIPILGEESTWQGPWQVGVVYNTADIIEEGGSSYIAVKSHTASLANIPPDATFWEVVAESGATGAQGETGMTGAAGPQGERGPMGVGVAGPQGAQGETGPAGSDGILLPTDNVTTFETVPDAMKPEEKVISGITYTAGNSISIATPDAMKPNEKVISFAPAQPRTRDNYQPSLGVNYIIATSDGFVYPSRNSSQPFMASISMFGGSFAPRGWAFCDGQLLAISSNQALFSLLGDTYGGDGRSTFALPDLRGRSAIHPGTGPGLSPVQLGQKLGTSTISLD